MHSLCLLSNMSSSDWAAWVQAFASATSIIAAVYIASHQAERQFKDARSLQKNDSVQSQKRVTSAIYMLAQNAEKLLAHTVANLGTREQIMEESLGMNNGYILGEISAVSDAFLNIPLHHLPSAELVKLTMILSSTMKQFTDKTSFVIRNSTTMSAEVFVDYFNSAQQMLTSVKETLNDLNNELHTLEHTVE